MRHVVAASGLLAGLSGLLLFGSQPPAVRTDTTVLQNVTLIDGTGAGPRTGVTIVIAGEHIQAVRESGTAPPDGARVLDLRGRFVVPGLIDSHIHLMHRYRQSREHVFAELKRMLYGGVVTAREMAGNVPLTAEVSQSIRRGDAPGPDLHYAAVMAGPGFFEDDPRPRAAAGARAGALAWSLAITAETALPRAVTDAAGTGAAGVKLYAQIEPVLLRRVTAEIHKQGLLAWSHATVYPSRPMDAVRAGIDSIVHACGLAWESRALDPARFATPSVENRPRFDPALVDADAAEMQALFAEMQQRRTIFEPTIAIHLRPTDDEFGCTTPLVTALSRAAHRAGVAISTGTDFVAPDDDPFPALHHEIEALVSTGVLSPLEALTAATQNGARALGLHATHGTIRPGMLANLVVLRDDPVKDVRALRSVVMVLKRGVTYERAAFVAGAPSQLFRNASTASTRR